MTIDTGIQFSGWILTVISVAIAVVTLYRSQKFRSQVEIDNWAELKTAIQVNAQCQIGLKQYIEKYSDNPDPEIVRRLSASDAFAQELTLGILKRVLYSNPKLTFSDISRWKAEGKIGKSQAETLVRIAPSPTLPNGERVGFTGEQSEK